MRNLKTRFRLTIGAKLIGLIALLLMSSVASLVWLSTRLFTEDNIALIQQANVDTASALATQVRELFENLTEKMRVLGTVLTQEDAKAQPALIHEFFDKDKDFLALYVMKAQDNGALAIASQAISPEMKSVGDERGDQTLAAINENRGFVKPELVQGQVQIVSVKLPDASTMALAIGVPFIMDPLKKTFSHVLVAVVKQSRFVKVFSDSALITSFMVDKHGYLLAHPDAARVAAGENVSNLGIVKQLLEGKSPNGQTRYLDPASGEAKLGAFKLVGFAGLGTVAEVPEAKALEAPKRVQYRSMLVGLIVLSIAFLAGYLYSGTITWPIKRLVEAARRISSGDFKINLKPKGRDEVAQLSTAFNEMAQGLEERDRVKETFNKFHNKEIADKLLSGEVKLGGERKEATIFFSDVRGFTAMSETMEPEQVVEMLNEYMTRMVAIVRSHHGIVDKYVGDAIMALWGVPIGGESDAYNALRACLDMRAELAKLNELRISRGQNALKIGMGLNTGPVIAGNIGSVEKMEYTVIGDSVNLASRMESMTKEYGTDLLVPKVIYEKLKDRFVWEKCQSARVKGKSSAIEIYKVKGYVDEAGSPVVIETPYSSYQAEKSDKVVHDDKEKPEHGSEKTVGEQARAQDTGEISGRTVFEQTTSTEIQRPEGAVVQAAVPQEAAELSSELPEASEPVFPPALGGITPLSASPSETAAIKEENSRKIELPPLEDPFILPESEQAKPSAEPKAWYLSMAGATLGPFNKDEIRHGVEAGELPEEMLVSERESGPWVRLNEVAEFGTLKGPGTAQAHEDIEPIRLEPPAFVAEPVAPVAESELAPPELPVAQEELPPPDLPLTEAMEPAPPLLATPDVNPDDISPEDLPFFELPISELAASLPPVTPPPFNPSAQEASPPVMPDFSETREIIPPPLAITPDLPAPAATEAAAEPEFQIEIPVLIDKPRAA